jgi:pyruvate,water dikinase
MGGFVSVLQTSMLEEGRSLRKLGDRNYLIVAHDYLNLNARLAYHYAMIDTVVGEVPENNYVAFRFQGGGAGLERRDLRAQFLAEVTAAFGFTVDRRGDLLNAWLRTAPRSMSEEGLTRLGLLMACSRQLDMLLSDRSAVRHFVSAFLAGKFDEFA